VVRDARAFARVQQVLRGYAEEVGDLGFVERRRVGDIDDDLSAALRLIEACAGHGIHSAA
jgi:hypothetical protein